MGGSHGSANTSEYPLNNTFDKTRARIAKCDSNNSEYQKLLNDKVLAEKHLSNPKKLLELAREGNTYAITAVRTKLAAIFQDGVIEAKDTSTDMYELRERMRDLLFGNEIARNLLGIGNQKSARSKGSMGRRDIKVKK